MGRQMLALAGVGGGLYSLKRGLEYVIKASTEQEKAEHLLSAAVEGSITAYKSYAAEMQSLTIYGDEQILSQMAYAKNLGVTTDRLKDATTAAIGLAAKYRIDLSAAMMLVGRASQGQTQMLTRYGIVIDQNLTAEEKFNEILRIGIKNFRLAEEQAADAAGSFSQWGNEASDLAEIIGGPLKRALSESAKAQTEYMRSFKTDFARWISDMEEGIEIVKKYDIIILNAYKKVYQYSPWGLAYKGYKKLTKPEPIAKPYKPDYMTTFHEEIKYEKPEWLKNALALNVMTKAQENAAASMYAMSMKARGLGDALAREQTLTQFSALAKVRYGADVAGAQAAVERFTKSLKEGGKSAIDIAAAERAMFGDMRRMTLENYQFRIRTIESLKQKYIDSGLARVQVERWYLEQVKKIDIERLRSSENLMDGLRAAGKQMEMEMKSWSQIGYDAAMTFQSSFANAFADVMMRMETFDDAWRILMRSVARSVISNIGSNIAGAMFSGIFGGATSGLFSNAGTTMAAQREPAYYGHKGIPADFMPRLHGGLRSDEFAAIIQKGEEIIPKADAGKRGGDLIIQFENRGTPQQMIGYEQREAEDERIVRIVVDDAQGDGPVRRMVQEVIANVE